MSADFVHLHVHTDFSLLDGASSIPGLAELAREHRMSAVAITDHGVMGGAIEFYQTMNQAGIKPIVGCETYVCPTTRFDKDPQRPETRGHHLVLLARDFTGYQNLCRLVSTAHLEGFWYKPRIDKELLRQHRAGLTGLSACLKGEIAEAIMRERIRDAKQALAGYLEIFGREHFFLEMMDHGMPEQTVVNRELVLLSREFDVPLVATNDVHYLRREHARAHDLLLCIQTRSMVTDEKRLRFPNDEFYFKSAAEMARRFSEHPEALSNTRRVAEQCNLILPFAPEVNHYPVYPIPDGTTHKDYLRAICGEGIRARYGFNLEAPALDAEQAAIVARLDHELDVIDQANYTSYFLVVWDFLRYARERDIPIGPGRGSGAGSLVAYAARITAVDPLRYGLLFERFLNPERISPPDFDIDLCERRRGEVIEYVRNKYGRDNVAQIGTYGTLKTKAVIKDVARVLGLSFAESNQITKLVPDVPQGTQPKDRDGRKIPGIQWALSQSAELRTLYEQSDDQSRVHEVIDGARPLEDLNRNMTIHAAGVIIGDQPLHDLVPLAHGAEKEVITQYAAAPCEALGLLKMDFLGLSTLTIISDALDIVRRTGGPNFDPGQIPLDDPTTYELLNKGDTVAVFQLESSGMQGLCKRFGVNRIEDIIALIALYRPGPMQFIDDFVARKSGQTRIEYDHPDMEPILRETCGIMLYQEQIMQVVQVMAGFSLGQADILRRAIGKKKIAEMAEMHDKFIRGCAARGVKGPVAQSIWEKIEKFAGYGFNKSHSAAYGILAYQTAYLKAHFPVAFMCAVLTNKINHADEVAFFIQECRGMGIRVLPPEVNVSEGAFTVDGNAIRFGFAAIKGVGTAAAEAIIAARRDGPFTNLVDFCARVGGAVNARMLECLARTGAFDSFKLKRSQLVAIIEPAVARAQEQVRDREQGQASLFDMIEDAAEAAAFDEIPVPAIPEYHEREMLDDEKTLIGFYVSGHPLGEFAELLRIYPSHTLAQAAKLTGQQGVKVGGIVTTPHFRQSKAGNPFAVFVLEDLDSSMECLVFGKKQAESNAAPGSAGDDERDVLAEVRHLLTPEAPVFIEAIIERDREDDNGKPRLLVDQVTPLAEVTARYTQELHIHLYEGSTASAKLAQIRALCQRHRGGVRLVFCITCANGEIAFIEAGPDCSVSVVPELLAGLRALIGEHDIHCKPDRSLPKPRPRRGGNHQFHHHEN